VIKSAIQEMTMETVTANELKTRGVSAVEEHLKTADEVVISVRGQDKYVVMGLDKYSQLREYELDIAVREARADYEDGRVITESVDDHMKRVTDAL
jgi:PHD/YefM family antitoxin component YafN of YafNO toxin-antitoxin module